jgi:hypothetical protein
MFCFAWVVVHDAAGNEGLARSVSCEGCLLELLKKGFPVVLLRRGLPLKFCSVFASLIVCYSSFLDLVDTKMGLFVKAAIRLCGFGFNKRLRIQWSTSSSD